MDPVPISRALSRDVSKLAFALPVTHVYNPLDYARARHEEYLERYARTGCEVLLLGMNPGPFGMAQTGVPFGEVELVRDWLGISGPVGKPANEHAKRPIEGFACKRREVSGQRVWSWARERFVTPERFFERFFVGNYCPLVFMEETARNRTPDKLPAQERELLFAACDLALERLVEALQPRLVVGVGAFARDRARSVFAGTAVEVGTILHPSPASPLANRGWAARAEAELRALGVRI